MRLPEDSDIFRYQLCFTVFFSLSNNDPGISWHHEALGHLERRSHGTLSQAGLPTMLRLSHMAWAAFFFSLSDGYPKLYRLFSSGGRKKWAWQNGCLRGDMLVGRINPKKSYFFLSSFVFRACNIDAQIKAFFELAYIVTVVNIALERTFDRELCRVNHAA